MSTPSSSSPSASDEGIKVLLVDDELDNLVLLEAILEELPVQLVKAHSGDEALIQVLKNEFAVILLDVKMRGLDGFATAKLIRGRKQSSRTPVIFLTAYAGDEFPVEAAYALGAVDYLVKPLVPGILKAKVAGFVDLFHKTEQVKLQAEQIRQMERKLADEQLRQRDERFQAIIDKNWDAMSLMDETGAVVYVSSSITRILGYTPEEFVGQNIFEMMHPDDVPRMRGNFGQFLKQRGTSASDIIRYRHQDGSWRWLEGTATNLLQEPHVKAIVGNFHDITELRKSVADLERVQDELRIADRRKDEFLATLAHELRNPLAPISNALQILQIAGNDPVARVDMLYMMERQVRQIVRLVDDLLDLSRITRGAIELRKQNLDITEIIRGAIETSHPLIEAAGHQLAVNLPAGPLIVHGDLTRLAQIVSNLLNNAAKYTPPNGHIWLTVGSEANQAVIRIRDDGMGIPQEMQIKVFEMFTQVDRDLNRSKGGLGIGLTLVRRLVEMHDGTVDVASKGPGTGSEFTVRLPIAVPQVAGHGASPPASKNTDRGARRRVVVVDDNQDAALSLAKMLQLLGHEVETAHDGVDALTLIEACQPDLVLMDIGMPRLDGHETCRRIRSQPWGKSITMVALTGWGQADDRRLSQEAGFDGHLVKPVSLDAIEKLLAGQRDI